MPPSARCRRQPTHTPREQAANIIGAHNAGIRRPRKHPGCRSTTAVRGAVAHLLATFAATGSATACVKAFNTAGLSFPWRHRAGPRKGETD
jgi:hypothetical protein